jgi:hypothetical protein
VLKRKTFLGIIIFCVFILGGVFGASANTILKEIKAYLDPRVQVEINGEKMSFTSDTTPIRYNNRIYLPIRKVSEMVGLNSNITYDQKTNTVKIGGPRYIDVMTKGNFYQLIINGNWNPSVLTKTKKQYSNWYMGVDFEVENKETIDLNTFVHQRLEQLSKYGKLSGQITEDMIVGKKALVFEYVFSDSRTKTAIIQNGTDFITIEFYISKDKYDENSFKEFEKILRTFNIQTLPSNMQ